MPEQDHTPEDWTPEYLRRAQMEDTDIQPIIIWKESEQPRPVWNQVSPYSEPTKSYWAQWDSLELRGGVLYRHLEKPVGDVVTWQLLTPRSFRQLHSAPTAGHFGVSKTLARVRQRFCWSRHHQDVRNWCRKETVICVPPGKGQEGSPEQPCSSTMQELPWSDWPSM